MARFGETNQVSVRQDKDTTITHREEADQEVFPEAT